MTRTCENRQYGRYSLKIPVLLVNPNGTSCWSMTENLSLGGLFFHSFHPPQAGESMDFHLGCHRNPGDLVLKGRVVHRKERSKACFPGEPPPGLPGAGVCFEDISRQTRGRLASLLLSQSPDSLDAGPIGEWADTVDKGWGESPEAFQENGYAPLADAGAIARLFAELSAKIREVRVKRPGSGVLYSTYFVKLEGGPRGFLVHAEPVILRDSDHLFCGGVQLVFHFSSEGRHYAFSRFVSPEALREPWCFPLPERVYVKQDARQARYSLEMRYPLTVEFADPWDPGRHVVKNVVDLSYRGLAFKNYPGEEVYPPGTYLPEVRICAFDLHCRQTDAVVRHAALVSRPDGEIHQRVGLEFPEQGFGRLEDVPAMKEGEMERITGDEPILSHLTNLARSRVKVLAETDRCILFTNGLLSSRERGGKPAFLVTAASPSVRGPAGASFSEGTITCHYLHYGMYHFFRVKSRRENGSFALDAPLTIYKAKRRRSLRMRPEKVPFRFGFLHPILGRRFVFPVRDISTRGLCFEGDFLQFVLWKGFSLRGGELFIGEERLPVGTVEIRSTTSVVNEDGQAERRCGVEFVDLPVRTERSISLHILRENNPQIRTLTSEKIENLWRLFYASGFIYPSKEAYIDKIRTDINETWKKLLSEETSFYKNMMFGEGEEEMGTASAVQIYENTWMFQHLAATGPPTKLVPKHVMLGLAQFLMENQEIQYLVTYFRPENTFPRKIYSGFLEAYPLEEHLLFSRYRFLSLDLDGPSPGARPPAGAPDADGAEIAVDPATEEEREVMENYLQKTLHPLQVRSRSLYRDEFHLPETSSRFFGRGLLRERHCLVARRGGRMAAFALLENASPGINLSGLMNSFSLWSLPAGGPPESAVRRALIRAVVERYRSWGARTAICLTEEQDLADYLSEGFRQTKEYVCFTSSRRTIKSYYDYVQERFGRLEQRQRRKPLGAGA